MSSTVGIANLPACTNLPQGAVRPCGREALYHVRAMPRDGNLTAWLCRSCGSWVMSHGRFAELHSIGQPCMDHACGISPG